MLTEEDKVDLASGVKDLVIFLNENGFVTTDSGDGTGELECSCSFPMIAFDTCCDDPKFMLSFADRLMEFLENHGVEFSDDIDGPSIQAIYNPADGLVTVMLYNVLSKDVEMISTSH